MEISVRQDLIVLGGGLTGLTLAVAVGGAGYRTVDEHIVRSRVARSDS